MEFSITYRKNSWLFLDFYFQPVPYFGVGQTTPDELFFSDNSVAIQVQLLNRKFLF